MDTMIVVLVALAFALPILANAATGAGHSPLPWWEAPMTPTGLAPDPAVERLAVVQVYAAPAFSWRGAFAVHTWVVVKPAEAEAFTRYDVTGWGGGRTVKVNYAAPDAQWFGKQPILLLDRRGPEVEPLIGRIEAAVASYRYPDLYRSWPGPNSNTFVAHIARSVPQLGLDMPANAVGKDYREWDEMVGLAPSGSGVQVSLYGLLGFTAGVQEGIEVNLLGLNLGVDPLHLSLRLPGIGRLP
jgi:hypothetical protein